MAIIVATGVATSSGCEATSMSAGHVPIPILIGPVRCIGCEPQAPPAGSVRIKDEARYTYMIGGGVGVTTWSREAGRSTIARKAHAAVGKSCAGELRVLLLEASAFSVYALIFAMYQVKVELVATPTVMPPEVCAPAAAPADESDEGAE